MKWVVLVTPQNQIVAKAICEANALANYQWLVSGYIEMVQASLPGKAIMLVNEDGQLRGLQHNEYASKLAGRPIVGNAVIVRKKADDIAPYSTRKSASENVIKPIKDTLGLS